MYLNTTPNNEKGVNPVPLFQRAIRYDRATDSRLCIKLITADNKAFPYYLIQLYQGEESGKFILNFALYPDNTVFEQIDNYMLTGLDFIIAGLNANLQKGHNPFNVANGQEFVDMLFANQEGLEKLVGSEMDAVYRGWAMAQRTLKEIKK